MRVLVVDDDPCVVSSLLSLLEGAHDATACTSGAEALVALRREPIDLVITDLRMPPPDGVEVLRAARAMAPAPTVVVLTGVNTASAAVEALRLGAFDYLVKPVEPSDLLRTMAQALDVPASATDAEYGILGRSPAIRQVRRLVPLLARSMEAVLVTGETGSGKDL